MKKVKYKNMWGYMNNNGLVRVTGDGKEYLTFIIGHVILYINPYCSYSIREGRVYFESGCGNYGIGNTFFVSENLNSKIYPVATEKWTGEVAVLLEKGLREGVSWNEFIEKSAKEMPILERILRFMHIQTINARGLYWTPADAKLKTGADY